MSSATEGIGTTILPPECEKLDRHPDLSVDQYNAMVKWCRDAIHHNDDFLYDKNLFDKAISNAKQAFNVPVESILSFVRNMHLFHVKITSRQVKAKIDNEYMPRYVDQGESIWNIAKSARYPPYLLARAMLEVILHPIHVGRQGVKEAVRDPIRKLANPAVIAEAYQRSEKFPGPPMCRDSVSYTVDNQDIEYNRATRLAREISHVIALDPMYGPEHDVRRHIVGLKYERLLESLLASMDIPFESEDRLRERGTSKTPDVLLSTPVAVQVKRTNRDSTFLSKNQLDWRPVCWIESKASFGDDQTHKDSVLLQVESYIHRFGPGMLVYWFGHAPILEDINGDLVITSWTLPDEFLLPTGEIVPGPSRTRAESYFSD